MSKEKHLPCESCGSTIDEYLYEYTDPMKLGVVGALVEVENLCEKCNKSRRNFDKMKVELLSE